MFLANIEHRTVPGDYLDSDNTERQRSILITGAASGIGRATARLFARNGWFVGCLDVNAAALDSLRIDLGADSDLLFNNAGIDAKGRFDAMAREKVVTVVNVNLLAGSIPLKGLDGRLPGEPMLHPQTRWHHERSYAQGISGDTRPAIYCCVFLN